MISPLILALFVKVTSSAMTSPVTSPEMRISLADTLPSTWADSPIVSDPVLISPTKVPFNWMSPLLIRSPVILRSALMMEGTPLPLPLAENAASRSSGFENMLPACLSVTYLCWTSS